jgi:hypothetical protein
MCAAAQREPTISRTLCLQEGELGAQDPESFDLPIKEGSMNENQDEMGRRVMQRFTDGKQSDSDNRDVGAVCETPRVIELGNVSEQYRCCNGDNE